MLVVEAVPHVGDRLLVEFVAGKREFEFVILTEIARLDGTVDDNALRVTLALELGDGAVDEFSHGASCPAAVEELGNLLDRTVPIDSRVGHDKAEGGKLARIIRYKPLGNACNLHQV